MKLLKENVSILSVSESGTNVIIKTDGAFPRIVAGEISPIMTDKIIMSKGEYFALVSVLCADFSEYIRWRIKTEKEKELQGKKFAVISPVAFADALTSENKIIANLVETGDTYDVNGIKGVIQTNRVSFVWAKNAKAHDAYKDAHERYVDATRREKAAILAIL